jgi:hypothetical protein
MTDRIFALTDTDLDSVAGGLQDGYKYCNIVDYAFKSRRRGRFSMDDVLVCCALSPSCATERPHRVSGPPAFFQASRPPWRWQALAMPASCAACTAMAERSPNAQ